MIRQACFLIFFVLCGFFFLADRSQAATELRQSTAVTVTLGPFLDEDDGKTAETALTITQADVRLSKNGAAWAQKGDTGSCTHQENGWYSCGLNTTDTGTLGRLMLAVHESGALPVWREFHVITTNAWDSKYSTDRLQVDCRELGDSNLALTTQMKADVNAEADTALTDYDGVVPADLPDNFGDLAVTETTGKVTVGTVDDKTGYGLADGAITAAKIATNAIGEEQLAPNAIGNTEIAVEVIQQLAQIRAGTEGTVYHVAVNGNDGSSGLSWDSAKQSPKTVIEAASAGDMVLLGPGTFALGTNTIGAPAGVSVIGAGRSVTIITSEKTGECTVNPGSNSLWADFTIQHLAVGLPFGAQEGGGDSAFTDVVLRRVHLKNGRGIQILHTTACSLLAQDVVVDSELTNCVRTEDNANHLIHLNNCRLSLVAAGLQRAIQVEEGEVRAWDTQVRTTGATSTCSGVRVGTSSGRAYLHNCQVYADGSSTVYSLENNGGTLTVCGCEYDRSKTTGTITEVSGLDAALASSPVSGSLMERVKAIDELTEASGSGDLTAMKAVSDTLDGMIEDVGGDRYTQKALEQSPSGGTNPNVLISTTAATVTDQTHLTLTAGSTDDGAYLDQSIVIYDASNSDYPSVRKVTAYTGATKAVTLDSAPDFTMIAGDGVKVFVTAPGTTAPTAAQVADAVWDETLADHTGTGSSGEAEGLIDEIKAKTDLLGSASITVASPVASDAKVTVTSADDYQSAEGRALDWINADGTWGGGDISEATVSFRAKHKRTGVTIDKAGSVITATGTQKVRVEFTNAESDAFKNEGWVYDYQIRLTLSNDHRETIVDSELKVIASLFGN